MAGEGARKELHSDLSLADGWRKDIKGNAELNINININISIY